MTIMQQFHSRTPQLQTSRLVLSAHQAADFQDLVEMWGDPAVVRFIGGRPFTPEEVWTRLLRAVGHWPLMGFGYWVVRERAGGRFVGEAGLERHGKKKWRVYVADVVKRLIAALEPDDTVIGGGNVKKLKVLPPDCRAGDNENAFRGGFRMWDEERSGTRAAISPQ